MKTRRLLASAVVAAGVLGSAPAWAYTTADLASLAVANVGQGACTANTLGGHAFESSCTGNGGQPEYWCADFVKWIWANRGVATANEVNAAAGSFYVYGQNHGTLHNTPTVGDAVVFNYAGGGYADHVAIVTKVNANGTIETVSGDWNGLSGSEAYFSSTSHVVLNAPAYSSTVGSTSSITGMKISGFISPVGVPPPVPELDAKFIGQSSDAPADPSGKAYFKVCTGEKFHFSFSLKNTGTATWTDVNDTAAGHFGKAVRLGVPGDKPDVFTGTTRVSLTQNANSDVNPAGGACTNAAGCSETLFSKAGIEGTAPAKPGVYKTTWQLVDEARAWFGPEMYLTYDVVSCPVEAGAPGADGGSAGGGAGSLGGSGGSAGGAGGATGDDGGVASEPGSANNDAPPGESGGCAVSSAQGGEGPSAAGLLVLGLIFVRRGRKASRA